MTEPIRLHGISRVSDQRSPNARAAVAKAALPLSLVTDDGGSVEYRTPQGGALTVTAGADARGEHFWATLDEEPFLELGANGVESLFGALVAEFRPVLARSVDGVLIGVVDVAETTGPVEFLDWIQYFSPPVVRRYGRDSITKAPFPFISWTEEGGCILRFAGSPFEEIAGRSAAAEALGINLRPAIARNPKTGAPIVLPWS